jgi:cytochrome c oxidase subunit 2
LSSVIDYLKANPASTAVISGYHDPTGDQAANEELAKNRAGSVRDALVAAGIAESRIDMQKPTVTTGGGTLEDARRVEVTVR